MDLALEEQQSRDRTVVRVAGDLDTHSAPKLRQRLVELVSEGHHKINVDLSDVEFLDAAGLAVLVGGLKRVRTYSDQGQLLVVCHGRIGEVFQITGLTRVFTLYDTLEQALRARD